MVYRTNLQICADVADVLNSPSRISLVMHECLESATLTEAILRDRLEVHKVPKEIADNFVSNYSEAKQKKQQNLK